MTQTPIRLADNVEVGGNKPILIAGPCVVESYEITRLIAQQLKEITTELAIPFVFKASFDKANRTALNSFRSLGFEAALDILHRIKLELSIPILTDIHETIQIEPVSKVVDILQIPAFLCRQTDLLLTSGSSGLPVNIKRGQFMAPEDMKYAVEKAQSTGNTRVFLTERGSSFGYHNLVVDMRALPIMRQFAPVIFDVTHSVQQPGGLGGMSGGQRQFGPYLARAAAAVGVDGFFIETHPDPSKALSDGANMVPLSEMLELLKSLLTIHQASQPFIMPMS